jgi:hypothetical protein
MWRTVIIVMLFFQSETTLIVFHAGVFFVFLFVGVFLENRLDHLVLVTFAKLQKLLFFIFGLSHF